MISNIVMDHVLVPFVINGYYQCGGASPDDMSLFNLKENPVSDNTPVIRNINISNIRARNVTASAGYIYGIPELPVEGLTLSNYSVEMIDTGEELKDKPIMAFHIRKTRGEGIFCANIIHSIFRDISVNIIHGVGMEFQNARDIKVYGLHAAGGEKQTVVSESVNVKFHD